MTRFLYQARNGRGEAVTGTLQAPSPEAANRLLRTEGKYLVHLELTPEEANAAESIDLDLAQHAKRVKRDEVIYFIHQLSIMVETGVPLGEALDSIADQITNPSFGAILEDVSNTVHSGSPLSSALASHPRVFPVLMVALIHASEVSGTMARMLDRVSTYLTKEQQMRQRVRGALMYPLFMLGMGLAVSLFLLTFVLPRFAKIYGSYGAALPTPTRILLAVSNVTLGYWYVWSSILLVAIAFYLWFRRQEIGRRSLDYLKLNLPVIGPLFHQLYIARALRTMGTMIGAGVPVLDVIAITCEVTNNVYYRELWQRVDQRLQQGAQLSSPLYESTLFPKSVARMIHSGEKAGRLGPVMERIASFTEHDFEEAVQRATRFIEPAIISVMGIGIGGVAISLLLPIFSLGRVIAGGD